MNTSEKVEAPCVCGCTEQTKILPIAPLEAHKGEMSLHIEFMYIDLSQCTRCQETDGSLDGAISDVAGVLRATGVEVTVQKIHVQSEEQARELGFISSPTIRLNGKDIQFEVKETLCESCGEVAGENIDCRVWTWRGEEYTAPPKGMIMEAILREVYGTAQEQPQASYPVQDVPDNLKRFFAATQKTNRCCG